MAVETRTTGAQPAALGAALPALGLGVLALTAFAAMSGRAPTIVLLLAGGGFAAMLFRYPFLGILIYLTTFLLTYPPALRGVGNLTINNLLGLVMLPLLLWGTLRDGLGWFLRARPLVFMLIVLLIMTTAGSLYNRVEQLGGRASVDLHKGVESDIAGKRAVPGRQLVRTQDQNVKFMTRYVFLLFFAFFVRTPAQLKAVLAMLVGILLLTYSNVSAEAGEAGWGRGRLRVVSEGGSALYTGTNPNKLAFYALFCLSFIWYYRSEVRSRLLLPVWALLAGSAIVLVPLTASRSGLLNLGVFFAVVIFEGRFSMRKVAGAVAIGILLVAQFGYDVSVLDLMLPERAAERVASLGADELLLEGQTTTGSFQRRAGNLVTVAKLISHNPLLGIGLGNYQMALEITNPTAMLGPPHNSYFWSAAEGGIVSLALYLAMFGWLLMKLSNFLKDYDARFGPVGCEWLVRATRTALILFMVFSMFADVWVNIFFHIVLGICVATVGIHLSYAETGVVPGQEPPPESDEALVL